MGKIMGFLSNKLHTLLLNRKPGIKVHFLSSVDRLSTLEGGNKIGKRSVLVKSELGFGTYLGTDNFFFKAKIGRYCSIGSHIRVIAGQHPLETFVSTHPAFFSPAQQSGFSYVQKSYFHEEKGVTENFLIEIGSDVWIGDRVSILEGVRVGHGAVLAAGTVVVKDVPPYTIVGGVPGKEIKKRFSEKEREMLLVSKWWDKDEDWIKNNCDKFRDIEKFLAWLASGKESNG